MAALDRVPAPVAEATHLEPAAAHGEPSAALGGPALTRLLSSAEAIDVDLDDLAKRVDAERVRMWQLLTEACARVDASAPVREVVQGLRARHPTADGLLEEVTALVAEVVEWTTRSGLVP